MRLHKVILLISLITTHLYALADTADRCVSLIDKRVQGNVLDLTNCNLTANEANPVLNFLNAHPAITELELKNNPNFGDEGIQVIAKTTHLTTLSFTGSELTNAAYAALAKNTSIKKLVGKVNDDSPDNVVEAPTRLAGNNTLTSINLSWVGVNDAVMAVLATMPNLEEIQIAHARLLKDDTLLTLNKLPKLKKLNVVYCYAADKTLAELASNPHLVEFGAIAGPKTLQAIVNNKNIKKLSLAIIADNESALADLKNNQSITSLTVYGALTNDTIETIASMSNLEELNINFSDFESGADNLFLLANLAKLQKLSIHLPWEHRVSVDVKTANGLAMNAALKELEIPNLEEAAGFELAKSASLERITIQNATPHSTDEIKFILNKSLAALAKIPSLSELNYSGNFTVDVDVATAMASNRNLKRVHFDRDDIMSKITASALTIFAKAQNLTDLKLASDNINDAATIALAGNKVLQRLSLESSRISTKGIYALSANQTLTALTLAINPINASAYNALLSNQAIAIIDVDVNFPRKHH